MADKAETVEAPRRRKRGRTAAIVVGVIALLALIILFATPQGADFRNLWTNGTIPALLFPGGNRTYSASDEKNLKAIRTALMLYEDSEGQFPPANGWMDAIEGRLTASDMSGAESQKKLVRPSLAGHVGEYGYAINDAAAGKYHGDAGAKTILIYGSKQTGRNAHGDPTTDRDGMGIDVDGTLVK